MSSNGKRRAKVDRSELFLEETRSICPVCKRVIAAEVNIRDNRVILSKRCPAHGPFEALVYSDAELYLAQMRFNKPGTIPLEFQTEVRDGCPLDCVRARDAPCNPREGPPGEVGEIVRFGVSHPAVNSVVFQPVTHSGRHRVFDPLERLTNADVMKLVAAQLPEWFRVSDFVPVPCCFPTCRSMCYALIDGGSFLPLTRLFDVEPYLDYAANRVVPDLDVRGALERMFSSSATPGAEAALLACRECGIDLPAALADVRQHAFVVTVQDFQDPYTLNTRQLRKCCVAEITPDGRLIPFCAYNSVGYREQVREQLSGVRVAPVVPNARPLLPLLEPTAYGSRTVRR
jgi:uncharacterized radical SAM superfamily Fe-S cluster-containing enzyme